jgi:hypothetical protein
MLVGPLLCAPCVSVPIPRCSVIIGFSWSDTCTMVVTTGRCRAATSIPGSRSSRRRAVNSSRRRESHYSRSGSYSVMTLGDGARGGITARRGFTALPPPREVSFIVGPTEGSDEVAKAKRFVVIEHFRPGGAPEVYRRFRDRGRMAPEGVRYISSWADLEFGFYAAVFGTGSDFRLLEAVPKGKLAGYRCSASLTTRLLTTATARSARAGRTVTPRSGATRPASTSAARTQSCRRALPRPMRFSATERGLRRGRCSTRTARARRSRSATPPPETR